jgi:hypothetical protein
MSALTAPTERAGDHPPEEQLGAALDRLRRAVDGLEAAMSRGERQAKSVAALEQELEVKARASRLDAAGAEVSGRIDAVMSNLQSLLVRA